MRIEEIEKSIAGLSPELQEKARECKDMKELNALLAENDVELSDETLNAVAGGCGMSSLCYDKGDPVEGAICPACGSTLRYNDMSGIDSYDYLFFYCDNTSCKSYKKNLWYCKSNSAGCYHPYMEIKKYG